MIAIRGAHEHNLQAIDVDIPRGALTVVTGVSGSGKSSLAFDTLCAEGRRRYLETFSSYARQFLGRLARPAVTRIDGLSPAVALDQSTTVASPRSTVGTLTEIYDLLRLLWARAGTPPPGATERVDRALFSFNSPRGACPRCRGLGVEDRLDPDLLVADPARSVRQGALRITTPTGYVIYSQVTIDVLDQVCRAHGFTLDVPWQGLTAAQRDVILNGSDRIRIPYGKHPLSSRLRWKGITAKPREEGVYRGILPVMEQILRAKRNRNILRFVRSLPCRACGGTRLRPEALAVTFAGLTIAEAAARSIDEVNRFFENGADLRGRTRSDLRGTPPGHGMVQVVEGVAAQVRARCRMLRALGLDYLTLDRESTTLSSGEAQRLRIARLAAIPLGGVLHVLDEPSVGLHYRDTARLLDVLRAVRDLGNTVVVVEHDEQTIRGADWLVDVGPGAGAAGGRLLYSGPARPFVAPPDAAPASPGGDGAIVAGSRTQQFLTRREQIPMPARRRDGAGTLETPPITRHNLKHVTATFKLAALNVVTGVSGAGKSTLVDETARVLGSRRVPFDKIIAVDQAPIGRTPRSNPATYTGLFDLVRDVFAAEPEAARRGFGKGRFSFNVRGGRCEACEGAGVLQVGMHFLGTVCVVCERCGGRRFNDETLEVTFNTRNVHDVLAMSITDAASFFADHARIARVLDAMCALGLGYLPLGHPATMLSGGEAQRVKLAAELARPGTGRTLYLLDEPTTGLHPADVALLLGTLDALVAKGNTVIAIEHDLDVIKTADWVVDLGPESGVHGGRVVASGTPEAIAACHASATGEALRRTVFRPAEADRESPGFADTATSRREPAPSSGPRADRGHTDRRSPAIRFANVTTHNLRNLDVEIPANRLTVITGVSGSGKSSLAFDTLVAESQQRFVSSFSTYARRFLNRSSEAEFDEASGLTPTIAISQRTPSRNPRSTVATLTDLHDYYRLLFARAGTRTCPACGATLGDGVCPRCGFAGVHALAASMFSPNSEEGACPRCRGLGVVLDCDPARLITTPSLPLGGGAMAGHKTGRFYGDPQGQHMAILGAVGRALDIDFDAPWDRLDDRARTIALGGAGDRVFDVEWRYARGNRRGVHRFQSRWQGVLGYVREEYERKHADSRGEAMDRLMVPVTCEACGGGKLKPEFLGVRFAGLGIHQLLAKSVDDSLAFFDAQATPWPPAATDLRRDVVARLRRLHDAGLGYLAMDRPAATLSAGEAQRVRLASAPGSGLTGITYVLDEPTAGLHPRDTARLIALLRDLRDAGNTVVVVEHDRDVVLAADHLVEIGPGAGADGGRIVAQGSPADLARNVDSRTARVLTRTPALPPPSGRRPLAPGISVRGASMHNLREIDVDLPANGLVTVTGVSGSGKSTLVFDVLAPALSAICGHGDRIEGAPGTCRELLLQVPFNSLVRVDGTAAPASAWSNPATQAGAFDDIRALFAESAAALARGLDRRHFSLQARGGRCEACEGRGQVRVAMDFLPDVWTTCEVCGGKRYGQAVLACAVDGRSIADVLDMTADEAGRFFRGASAAVSSAPPAGRARAARADRRRGRHARSDLSRIVRALDVLHDVGLGYVRLGQPTSTLSGGERQRLHLAVGLSAPGSGPSLYLFDEPTTGLHSDDVARLMQIFDRLIAAGHTVIVVEHNLDVIAASDWVIDLGPEGGDSGGRVVAAGPPEAIAASEASHTGAALRAAIGLKGESPASGVRPTSGA